MKLKLDENGHVVVKDGQPVYVWEDGREAAVDVPGTFSKITALNKEAQTHREGKEAAEARLKSFEGIEDAEAARKALATVANLKDGDLVKAEKVEEIKAAARKAAEEQLSAANKSHAAEIAKRDEALTSVTTAYENELVGGSFTRSPFITEKVAVPVDMVQAMFGRHFRVEGGKIVASFDVNGTDKVYSRAKAGELADFEEALELLVDKYPNKDHILKGPVKPGSGTPNGDNKPGLGGKPLKFGGTKTELAAGIAARFPNLKT